MRKMQAHNSGRGVISVDNFQSLGILWETVSTGFGSGAISMP
jgi:hypothetical protein